MLWSHLGVEPPTIRTEVLPLNHSGMPNLEGRYPRIPGHLGCEHPSGVPCHDGAGDRGPANGCNMPPCSEHCKEHHTETPETATRTTLRERRLCYHIIVSPGGWTTDHSDRSPCLLTTRACLIWRGGIPGFRAIWGASTPSESHASRCRGSGASQRLQHSC